MKAIRLIFASLLALVSLLCLVGYLSILKDHERMHALEHVRFIVTLLGMAAAAIYYFRSREYWNRNLTCPHCHARGTVRLSALGQPRVTVFWWLIGGFIGSLLYSHWRPQRFQCEACGQSCELRSLGGRLAGAWLLLLIFQIAVALYLNEED